MLISFFCILCVYIIISKIFNVYLTELGDSPELFVVVFEDFNFACWEIFHDF